MKPTVDEIITACDCALESANRHSENAYTLWTAVAPFIDINKQPAAARALADVIASRWEDYLENVVSYSERLKRKGNYAR